jgi:dynein heavy chain
MKYDDQMKVDLQKLFDKYLPDTLFHCAKTFKHIIPQVQISMVMSMCKLLENIFKFNEVKGLEYIFVFAVIWCVGGGYAEKDGKDFSKEFSNWWKSEYKIVRFPSKGTVFDYYVDIENSTLEDWSKMSSVDIISTIDTSKSIPSYTIPTVNTISASYLMK